MKESPATPFAQPKHYDFSISTSQERYEEIRKLDFVDRSSLVWEDQCRGFVTAGTFSEEFLKNYRLITNSERQSADIGVNVFFLEDEDFRAYLTEQGLDPEPYFTSDTPQAVCVQSRSTIYHDRTDGTSERPVLSAPVFAELPAALELHSQQFSSDLTELVAGFGGGFDLSFSGWEGNLVMTFTFYDALVPEEYPANADGTLSFIRIPEPQKPAKRSLTTISSPWIPRPSVIIC